MKYNVILPLIGIFDVAKEYNSNANLNLIVI